MPGLGFKVADAYVDVHADSDSIRASLRGLPGDLEGDTDRAGHELGGNLSKGVQRGFISSSPMIAAAVTGGILLGAPAAIAGAGVLFGGIGAVALKNNDQLKKSWSDLGKHIQDSAAQDAAVLIPTYQHIATEVGAAFDTLRPQLREAFAATGPLMERLTAGMTDRAKNAMPGLVSAVRAGGPVFDGLRTLLADTGTGIGKMFSEISQHGGAAGTSLAAIGSIVQSLLPVIGKLMGSGAELGSMILPPLAKVVDVLASALEHLGPVLPLIAAGFAGFKLASTVTGWLGSLTGAIEKSSASGGLLGKSLGSATGALSTMGSALPVVGIALGLYSAATEAGKNKIDAWAAALLAGGDAATKAAAETKHVDDVTQAGLGGLHSWGDAWDRVKALTLGTTDAQAKAHKSMQDQLNDMPPLQRAQTLQTQAQNDWNNAIDKYGPKSAQAVAAGEAYRVKSDEVRKVKDEESKAISGVTQSMVDEMNQILAASDSNLAYRNAAAQTKTAQDSLNQAIKQYGPNSSQAAQAGRDFEGSLNGQIAAAGKMATDALPSTATAQEKQAAASRAQLAEGYKLQDQFGAQLPAAVRTTIGDLNLSADTSTRTGARFDSLGLSVRSVPSSKQIIVDAPTAAQEQALRGLGFTVTHLPNGTVSVTANTGAAEAALAYAARNRTATIYVNTIANAGPALYHVAGAGTGGYASGGEVSGPGTTTSDSVPATGPGGGRYALSNKEWIIQASSAQMYGKSAMAAVNDGRAVIAYAGGGQVDGSGARNGGSGVTIQNANFSVQGVWDFTSTTARRQVGEQLRQLLREIDRSYN